MIQQPLDFNPPELDYVHQPIEYIPAPDVEAPSIDYAGGMMIDCFNRLV
ncbi:hypothetical protein ACFQ38_05620 [Sporosarcina contaminans]|uniref:Uncharacterized protein n=1 Tax=Sporosarcina contaminans TaxID=633403 RepID=A0ABW3TYT2_9BACL